MSANKRHSLKQCFPEQGVHSPPAASAVLLLPEALFWDAAGEPETDAGRLEAGAFFRKDCCSEGFLFYRSPGRTSAAV